jgi:SAM-dependent methyltransferase
MSKHWTEKLFLEAGDSFRRVLEGFVPQAAEEVKFIRQIFEAHGVRAGKCVLDLACGIGRHSVELARLGYQVTGVDLAPTYIAHAKDIAKKQKVSQKTRFLTGDMREVDHVLAGERFDAVINLFTSFGFFDEETNVDVLRRCRELTRKGGLFLIDVINRDWLAKNFQPRSYSAIGRGDLVLLEERTLHQEIGRHTSRWIFLRELKNGSYKREGVIDVDLRVYNLHELIELFRRAGWKYREAYGSLTGAPLEVASRRLVGLFAAA